MQFVKNLLFVLVVIGIFAGGLYAGVSSGIINVGFSGGGPGTLVAAGGDLSRQSFGGAGGEQKPQFGNETQGLQRGGFGQRPGGDGGPGGGPSSLELIKNLGIIVVISLAVMLVDLAIGLLRKTIKKPENQPT